MNKVTAVERFLILQRSFSPIFSAKMPTKSQLDIGGMEYDWLATDQAGNVALMSTAGVGFAPDAFLQDVDIYDGAIELIVSSPRVTSARFAPSVPDGAPNIWLSMAERGIFAYDADYVSRIYRLVAAPAQPILVSELAREAALVVRRILFHRLVFQQTTMIREHDLLATRL